MLLALSWIFLKFIHDPIIHWKIKAKWGPFDDRGYIVIIIGLVQYVLFNLESKERKQYSPGVHDEWGSLACCSPWGRKDSGTTEWLNWTRRCRKRKTLRREYF